LHCVLALPRISRCLIAISRRSSHNVCRLSASVASRSCSASVGAMISPISTVTGRRPMVCGYKRLNSGPPIPGCGRQLSIRASLDAVASFQSVHPWMRSPAFNASLYAVACFQSAHPWMWSPVIIPPIPGCGRQLSIRASLYAVASFQSVHPCMRSPAFNPCIPVCGRDAAFGLVVLVVGTCIPVG